MTMYMKLREFIDAIKTEQTRITVALEQTANDPAVRQAHGDEVRRDDAFKGPLVPWLREQMLLYGALEGDLEHADHLPDPAKEIIRAEVAAAFEQDRPVHFRWKLGQKDHAEIDKDETGDSVILIVSPTASLKVSKDGQGVYDERTGLAA